MTNWVPDKNKNWTSSVLVFLYFLYFLGIKMITKLIQSQIILFQYYKTLYTFYINILYNLATWKKYGIISDLYNFGGYAPAVIHVQINGFLK